MTTKLNSKFDFKNIRSFARPYLDTYYVGFGEDEPVIARFLTEKGRALNLRNFKALEIGCGPTVHRALSIAPYIKSLDMADYLPENLEEVRNWQKNKQDAFSWNHYTKMIIEVEGKTATKKLIKERENILRKKIRNFYHCDVTNSPPLAEKEPYPVVLSFYCAEEVGITTAGWERAMKNISMMVAPGGYLFLATLRDAIRYILGDLRGEHEWLPCARVTKDILRSCLIKIGFVPESIEIISADTPAQTDDTGIVGVLIVTAQKSK